MQIEVYTDGGCSGNPGCGAWAFVVVDPAAHAVLESQSGHHPQTTNNRMELQAAIEALQCVHHSYPDASFPLFTDSQYVYKGITIWIHDWMRNNWRSKAKKAILNVELWQTLYHIQRNVAVEWRWLKGHAQNYYNERCHSMVQQEISRALI